MWIFTMLPMYVCAILFCGIMSESLSLTDISQKLDYIINDLKEKDFLDGCELPEDKNVVSTVIGLKLHENPEYIPKNFYANFRCKVPSLFHFRGPTNMKCNGPDSDRIINPQCVLLKNETEWQAAMLKWDSQRNLCYNGSSNSSGLVYKDPLSRSSYFECVLERSSQNYKLEPQNCLGDLQFDYISKLCVSYPKSHELLDFTEIGIKPSIVVDANGSTWDSMGWLLVERGSNVTLDCVYPKVARTNVNWYRNDFGNTDIYDGIIQISGQWISEYRNRIVLNEVDYNNTGMYICQGRYYTPNYYSETNSHAVTIALKEIRCSETALPDFELHHEYYRDYPFMKHVKKRCQETS